MNKRYTANDLIELVTKNGSFYHFKSYLQNHFETVKDFLETFPDAKEIDLPIEGIQDLLIFLDDRETPSTPLGWSKMLNAADYLGIDKFDKEIIMEIATEHFYDFYDLTGKDITYYLGPVGNKRTTFDQVVEEFQGLAHDPNFY